MKTNPVHKSKPVINERYRDLTSTNECDFRVAETDPEIAALELGMTPGWNRTRTLGNCISSKLTLASRPALLPQCCDDFLLLSG